MTSEQFNALKIGDLVRRKTTFRTMIVTVENRGITPGANQVSAQVRGADGKARGRGYTINETNFTDYTLA